MADATGDGNNAGRGDLKRLTRSGLFDEALEAPGLGREGDVVTVRPVIDDLVEEWVGPLVDALDPRVGDRIAVAGDDGATAGRVACSAAAWLADRGRSVTLVDASIEQPVVAKALPEDGDEGVVDVVNFGVSPDAVRRRTLATRVALVTSGSYAVSPHDVLASATFGEMLSGYASGDVVIVIVPPDLLEDAAPAFNAVVVVGGSPDRLESNGARLSDAAARQPLRRVAILTARPAAVAEEVMFTGEAPVVHPEPEPDGGPGQEEAAAPAEAEPEHGEAGIPEESEKHEPEQEVAAVPAGAGAESSQAEPGARRNDDVFLDEDEWYDDEEPLPAPPRPRRRLGRIIGLVIVAAALAFVVYGMWWAMTGGGMGWMSPGLPEDDLEAEIAEGTTPTGPDRGVEEVEVDQSGTESREAVSDEPEVPVRGTETEPPTGDVRPPDDGSDRLAVAALQERTETSPASPVDTDGLRRGPGGRFVVLVSSHKHESAARRDAAAFQTSTGFASAVTPAEVGETGTWYRVVVDGGFPSLTGAREVLDTVKEFGYEGAWIERSSQDQ